MDDDISCGSRGAHADAERVRSLALQSIQYLASHVPTSVLERLSEETMVGHDDDDEHSGNKLVEATPLCEEKTEPRDEDDNDVPENGGDDTSEVSEISDLSHEDESDCDLFPRDERVPLHKGLTNGAMEGTVHRGEEEHTLLGDFDEPVLSPRGQQFHYTTGLPRPPRRRKIARRSSKASILSHRYFDDSPSLPYASKHDSALLFVDISGFTRLSTLLDPECLSRAINEYFQLIVNEVTQHHGDILKFAGDSLFAMWKVSSSRSIIGNSIESDIHMNMEDCVTAAAVCGAKIVSRYCGHPIFVDGVNNDKSSREGNRGLTLNVHCGVSFGKIVSVHAGDNESRRENIVLGKPIYEVGRAAVSATLGEVVACPVAIRVLSITCKLHNSIDASEIIRPAVIANQSTAMFTPTEAYTKRYSLVTKDDPLASRVTRLVRGLKNVELLRYRKLLSLYVHPVVTANDAAGVAGFKETTPIGDRQVEEAELRNVFVMFIAPLISVSVSGDDEKDSRLFSLLNSIMNVTTRELARFGGHFRQYIVDDKGLVLIATFGLRGSTFHSMVSERALPSTIAIHNILLSELGVQTRIGATVGNSYCGVVGGLMRHEYAVLGPSVNLAARLMTSTKNPGILVDNAIRLMAYKSYGFRALHPVEAKGYTEPVPIFEPLSPLQRRGGCIKPNFVGRRRELGELKSIASHMALSSTNAPSRLILVSGISGLGKSTLVVHAIEEIRQTLRILKKRIVVTKYVSRESDILTPFGAFGAILLDAMASEEILGDDRSVNSIGSFISNDRRSDGTGMTNSSRSWGSHDGVSISAKSRIADRLSALCNEFNAPPEFAELVGQHLLQIDLQSHLNAGEKDKNNDDKRTNISLVNFVCRAFLRFTQDADLVVIALDDVHLADEISFKVVQELFETGSGVMIICTSRPLSTYKLAIDDAFWERLQTEHVSTGRYVPLKLSRLDGTETKTMIAKTLRIKEDEISERLLKTIFAQSTGIPQFAHVLIEHFKKESSSVKKGDRVSEFKELDSSAEPTVQTSLRQLILQRIDRFRGPARNALNLAAVMGLSFEFVHLIEVIKQLGEKTGNAQAVYEETITSARDALTLAVNEGILYAEYNGGVKVDYRSSRRSNANQNNPSPLETCIVEDLTYFFSHDMWRSSILELMLQCLKSKIHRAIALTLKAACTDDAKDYMSRLRLFGHWKSSGDFVKASTIALDVGKMFEDLGLNDQCIHLYRDTLDMWKKVDDPEQAVAGFSRGMLSSISSDEVAEFIKLCIALGKALTNLHRLAESVDVYQNALLVLKESKTGSDIADRSVVFPVFSGLFLGIKFGQIQQDEARSYEQTLVARFVIETKMHGDPIHYARALAMQVDTFARLGDIKNALSTHFKLREVYQPDDHSDGICHAYGSDRAAQSISMSALWLVEVGNTHEALSTCDLVICDLIPKMEPRNVHNSFVMLFPIIWVLKDNGMALRAKDSFETHVVNAFQEYFGDGAFTFFLPLYDPIVMLMDLYGNQDDEVEDFEVYLSWGLCEDKLRFGEQLNNVMINFGRNMDSISAEICLLLAKRVNCASKKKKLIKAGLALGEEAVEMSRRLKSYPCLRRTLPILRELERIVQDEDY